MKNIHVLPTDKPSRVYLDSNNNINITDIEMKSGNKQNICITSDEEIKEGDWCLDLMNNTIYVATKVVVHNLKSLEYEQYLKKIVLTTDQDLIKDGVQAIDDEFLEWFIKNSSCDEVKVKDLYEYPNIKHIGYKIIIPKEEPKQEYEYQSECICGTECKEFTNVKCKKK